MPYIRKEEWRAIQARLAAHRRFEENPGLIDDSELLRPRDNMDALREAIHSSVLRVKAGAVRNALVEQVILVHGSREGVWLEDEVRQAKGRPFRLTDTFYDVMTFSVFERVLASRRAPYRHELYRGEPMDFARAFRSECIGWGINSVGCVLSWGSRHAFNIAVCREGTDLLIVMVEPSTRAVVTDFTGKHSLRDILVILS